jgi:hypothetical protein
LQDCLLEIARGGEFLTDELPSHRVDHRPLVSVRFHGDERGAADLVRTNHPAGELGRQRRLPFAALPPHQGVPIPGFVAEQPLERQQFPAATDEARRGHGRHVAEA